ncbi:MULTISPECIES: multidrug efflux SMR transporter [unclassified Oceanobacter]|jgi:quaternary ammonium compound-resistance protein SugE|uniref:DMT family transporter n=1 Tax=unclassified Oceanobacter TaxID=2620260 RepID=UPI0026E23EC5|nr:MULTISPECIES: multidrug efflux SMR transporter [unclassified Oceanobacter]MDO6682127.1 multidrug efflux SMR transporter [Oceanobacter sp. 5_MG-2023]MDP2505477.1 multidrug efflux SMR transporter [Oceanobacter sp. 3_MG-2023]MDP2548622.1 multidrug efflux SMR transporter [Oceanobacter sp. 4_MG-2023]MDP2610294.1 multidrug efflux SMR transporter [Oceanobacter sp. 1_MG-2023]MDP2613568.1 multidrug efflux SMR transporter [Oceanobacter sp. 2_MG-2023]
MGWIYLLIAGGLECLWAIGLKQSDGFSKLWPSVITVLLIIASMSILSLAMRTIPMGTAYAVWAGIGTASIALVGILFMNEPGGILRLACIGLIVLGVVGLKLVEGSAG